MRHIQKRLMDRGLDVDWRIIEHLSRRCGGDTALIIHRFSSIVNESCLDYKLREESNGDLLVLLVRHNYPVTIMFRRYAQNNCIDSLRVKSLCDVSGLYNNEIVKDNKNGHLD